MGTHVLESLLAAGRIRVRNGEVFGRTPPTPSGDIDSGRVEGMLLGLAIGDALGNTTEGRLPAIRRERFGEIRDYLHNRHHPDGFGCPSDDTQLAFWTIEQLLEDGRFDPAMVAAKFAQGRIFGIGSAVRQFQSNYGAGKPWDECGGPSAGNGSLMRVAPALIPHLRAPSPALWADTAVCGMITHNDSVAIASCVGFVAMLWDLLAMERPPAPEWWLERMTGVLRDLECEDSYEPRSPELKGFRGPLWKLLEQEIPSAWGRGAPVVEACNRWYSGAYLLETVPCAVYILMRHGNDPEEAILRAVNDTLDNDTIAAIVGAAVGALHGKHWIPRRWIEGLSGRTREDDDGRVFELAAAADSGGGRFASIAGH